MTTMASIHSRDQPFQLAVLLPQLPDVPQLSHAQVGVLFLPRVEGIVICSSENFDRFIGPFLSSRTAEAGRLLQF
jgi:hypothetical protein